MLYGLDCKKWEALAKDYLAADTETRMSAIVEELSFTENQAWEHIDALYCLIMDETEEAYTQEWRENLSKEEAAAVAVLDGDIEGNLERMWLDLADMCNTERSM